jgi:hypothetical protein
MTFNIALANPQRTIPLGISRNVLASTSKEEFTSRLRSKYLDIWYERFNEITRYIEQTYEWRVPVEQPRVIEDGRQLTLPNDIRNWVNDILRAPRDGNSQVEKQTGMLGMLIHDTGRVKKALCIIDPSHTRKTSTWARSLGPHIICRRSHLLPHLRSAFEADYAIFENIDIHSCPWQKFVTGGPFIRIWGTYEQAEQIRWGIPSIFVFDEDPRLKLEDRVCDFWNSHILTFHISEPL